MKLSDFNADLNEVQWIPMTFNRSSIEYTCISYECKWSEMPVWIFNEFQVFEKIFDCTFTKSNDLFNVFHWSVRKIMKKRLRVWLGRLLRGGPINLKVAQTNHKDRRGPQTSPKDRLDPPKSKKPTKPIWTMNGKRVFHVFICIIYVTGQKLPI